MFRNDRKTKNPPSKLARTLWSRLFATSWYRYLPVVARQCGIALLITWEAHAIEIQIPTNAQSTEKTAADELAGYIRQITGNNVAVKPEGVISNPPVIYVGNTQQAVKSGMDNAKMSPEEWVVESTQNDLVITGGQPRGIIYGVYHYLEDCNGVRFWTHQEDTVPPKNEMPITGLKMTGKPAFDGRTVYSLYLTDSGRFAAKLRITSATEGYYGQIDAKDERNFGMQSEFGPPDFAHSFAEYIPYEEYFKEHPEWFSLVDGKRFGAQGSGTYSSQLCLSNKELRKEMLTLLKENIRKGREEAAAWGVAPPQLYDVSQNDNGEKCTCPDCQAIVKKYGAESGMMLDFVNELADGIQDEFPEARINTFAYMYTEAIPRGIVPRPNVSITLVDTTSNQSVAYTKKDNPIFCDLLEKWGKIAPSVRVWIYGKTFASPLGLPYPSADIFGDMFKSCQANNVTRLFVELENPIITDNYDYKLWMWAKLAENPNLDQEKLSREFADGYYGAAGKYFSEYLKVLRESQQQKRTFIGTYSAAGAFTHLDLGTVHTIQKLFDDGEEALRANQTLLRRWRMARLPIDRATLLRGRYLMAEYYQKHNTIDGYPFNRKTIVARIDQTVKEQVLFRKAMRGDIIKSEEEYLNVERPEYLKDIPVKNVMPPKQFASLPVTSYFDFTAESPYRFDDVVIIKDDPETESGTCCYLPFPQTHHKHPLGAKLEEYSEYLSWGVYSEALSKTLKSADLHWKDVPGSGYNWYNLGTSKLTEDCYLYFFPSWSVQYRLGRACNPMKPDREYEIWAKIKFTGPDFPHGQTGETNAISIERIIVVRPKK